MKMCDFVLIGKGMCKGGMQDNNGNNNINATNEGEKEYEKEIKTLIRLFGDSINKKDLKKKIINNNGRIELVIKELVQLSVENEDESKSNELENIEQVITKLFYLFYDFFFLSLYFCSE
ncbi:hypothetical protein RFI_25900 [Reticulomyxa filosa]|uniref:Uncharacterized protein n=1 Tax=Reticulomyxa filosa TaxID=46433 RepID=X6MBU4_RETFI|nr:hypothetical protein RFI_25900 [Reticulomyxa filosa]|eukprot:ETO11478.1 hypothetical protein RFI_25900 [Reticulomyxa filosa]